MSVTAEHIGATRVHRPTLSHRFGSIDQVLYHQSDWSPTPSRIKHRDGVTLLGAQLGKVALLVEPPSTDASDAYTAMTTAASVADASTPDELLTINECSAEDPHRALIALHRWECEGGALLAPSTSTAG